MTAVMLPERSLFLIYAVGIFTSYFLYGIVQEKVTRGRYGDVVNKDGTIGERFTYTLALVWVQCVCNYIFAKGLLVLDRPVKEDTTSRGYYAVCALTYLLGFVASNMALRWVPYPTQVVGKSAKPIPVMILGVLVGHKSYSVQRYACVLTIVVGVVLFMYKECVTSNAPAEGMGRGEILLVLSLAMDGLTGAIQELIRASAAPCGQQMMLAMNFWSSLMLGSAIIVTGEGKQFWNFTTVHPELWIYLIMLALCGAIGQTFIFLMVARFGPLACSVVTTTRKFFTVLCSVIFFGNTLILRQWFGAVLVFVGLFVDILYGKKRTSKTPTGTDKDVDEKKKLSS